MIILPNLVSDLLTFSGAVLKVSVLLILLPGALVPASIFVGLLSLSVPLIVEPLTFVAGSCG